MTTERHLQGIGVALGMAGGHNIVPMVYLKEEVYPHGSWAV